MIKSITATQAYTEPKNTTSKLGQIDLLSSWLKDTIESKIYKKIQLSLTLRKYNADPS